MYAPPPCNFNGHERNMHQRHLTAGITELIARTSLVVPTGVSTCGNHTNRASTTQNIYLVHIPCFEIICGPVHPGFVRAT